MAMSTCVGCSQEIPGSAAYCPRCGTPNPEAPTIPTPTGGGSTERIPADELKPRLQRALGRDFAVERLLGEGGFAVVFAAHDRKLSRRIAVKVLRPELTTSRSTVQRFVREAESVASLSHPHILPIFFVGEGEGLAYFGMPLVEGETLEARLSREGQLPETDVVRIGAEIADALAEAHGQGLVHRDVKPANVLLQGPKRRVLVTDFGIAKAAAAKGDKLTGTGVIIGSPHYMSPEQASGSGEVDHRSDIYSLGVLLWQMLAGAVPFDGPDSQAVLVQHLTKELPPLRSRRRGVTPRLALIVERCCAKKRETRFQSAAEVAEALRSGLAAAVPLASRKRQLLAGAVISVVVIGAGALVALQVLRETGGTASPVGQPGEDTTRSPAPIAAVLPFDVNITGDTAQLARQSARSLTNTLGSRFGVGTVDPNRLLGLWAAQRRTLAALPDSNAAFAYRHGANQLVIGSAFQAGRLIRVGVDVYDTRTYSRLGHYELDGGPDALIPLLDQLAESVAVAFCKQPEFNPRNLCFDTPVRVSSPVVESFAAVSGQPRPATPAFYVLVSRDGAVSDVRVKQASSADEMQASLGLVEGALYVPAMKRGVRVAAWTTVHVPRRTAAGAGVSPPGSASVDSAAVASRDRAPAQCATNPSFSLANRGNACYDQRPRPRTAPIMPAPESCTGSVTPVTLMLRVSAQGEVDGQPSVSRRSNCDAFTQNASSYALDLTFTPATKAGRPVPVWMNLQVQPLRVAR